MSSLHDCQKVCQWLIVRGLQASKLPPALDRAWEAVGGGPSDLYFPDEFLGVWSVESTLASVQLPLGPDFVPDTKVQIQEFHRLIDYFVHASQLPKRSSTFLECTRALADVLPGR